MYYKPHTDFRRCIQNNPFLKVLNSSDNFGTKKFKETGFAIIGENQYYNKSKNIRVNS